LNSYILCESSPALASCAGLATQLGGRPVIHEGRELLVPELIEKNIDVLTEELAEKIYSSDPTTGEHKVQFTDLAPSLQVFYLQQARRTIVQLIQKATIGRLDDYTLSVIVRSTVSFSKKVSLKTFTQKIPPVIEYLKNVTTRSGPMVTTRIPAVAAAEAGAVTAHEAALATQAMGRAAPLFVARLISLISLSLGAAGDWLASTTPVGCAGYGDSWIHHDENCRPLYSIDENVVRFLNLKDEEQSRYLNAEGAPVCQYYKNLLETLFKQPQFVGLECNSQGFTLRVQDDDGKKRSLKALYFYQTRDIKQINLNHPNPIEINRNGIVRGIESSDSIAREVVPLKLYIMDAYDCCNAEPESRRICLDIYNGR
jgi:hypothetical protein